MDLIILNNDIYHLMPVTKQMLEGLHTNVNFYELCDLLRLKLTTYYNEINIHSMNDGSGQWFGCIST